ncbi:MAG: hypothetical protein LM559_02185 [Pyrobaculum sp.]|nr:hypothetical protein [Pyrobaculum sp.]
MHHLNPSKSTEGRWGFARRCGMSGGGHPNAAGARMPKRLPKTLVEELNRLLEAPSPKRR